ncbi:MAG TPA: hypothetical protein VGM03_05570 [Phycisphaerae bacterium]
MVPIVSRTTNERIIRMSIMAAILVPYTLMCFYDGYVAYPRQNLAKAIENLPARPAVAPPINRAVTKASVADLHTDMPLSEIVQRFGPAGWQSRADDGSDDVRYFGPGVTLKLKVANGRVSRAEWAPGGRSETDLKFQIGMGVVLAAVTVPFLLFYFGRVLGFRCVLSDAGLKHPGHPLIPFEAMQSLTYVKSGLFDLAYEVDGRAGNVRLDNYKIKAFDAVVDEICQHRNFPWPVRAPANSAETQVSEPPPSA